MILIDAWLDGGSSDPEAKIEVAEYVEDPEQTYLSIWSREGSARDDSKIAEVVIGDDQIRELIRALSMRLAR